ncbi:hypothetical protein [Paraburkholderia aspalathi]|uniref:hypothetical protein n=1 Tax=Paraburkholderia aspalathi TaxID=1324617 RepID=UPI003CA6AB75
MTAEVAIANKYGVALSADSAVTIGGKKIYNSANKLFALTKKQPVGIMIYGSAQLDGVPWETLIKYYRSRILKENSFSKLQEYQDHFIDFVKNTSLISQTAEEIGIKSYFHAACTKVVKQIIRFAEVVLQKKGNIDRKTTSSLVKISIEQWTDKMVSTSTISPALRRTYIADYGSDIERTISILFEKLPITKILSKKLVVGIVSSLFSEASAIDGSGVVIAGFGEDDVFPAIAKFGVEGRHRGHLKLTNKAVDQVSHKNRSMIVPFAQREMVTMFMEGIDPEYRKAISNSVSQLLQDIPDLLRTKHGITIPAASKSAIVTDLQELHKNFNEGLTELQRRQFVRPVIDSVAALPLDELASMANALVNLTSFKRRVTMVLESVGGPVDTAVISKGDGFIWINRKHYFKPELNPHYFDNCFQEQP